MTDTIASSNPATADVHPRLIMDWQPARPARTVVHELLYDPTPAVSLADPGPRRGVLRYFFETASQADACWAMHAEKAVLTLTAAISDHTETLRYVVAGGDLVQRLDPESALRTIIEVPYLEVPA
ncbi:hypothetical protein ACFPZL_01165 [Leucobacter soli]|uniref:Uncharacterized protein n=1 Tax=Leucobacter soli TaxID=2812850 RepID=A0A916K1V3_9MICO|nr:hypothetical protein [Leucobacter soli]CAG7618475.1 hypothetical protein LEUCIP111803_02207 [Leucobacter soli]